MKYKILLALLLAFFTSQTLTSCGMKRPLYLPIEDEAK